METKLFEMCGIEAKRFQMCGVEIVRIKVALGSGSVEMSVLDICYLSRDIRDICLIFPCFQNIPLARPGVPI